MPSKSKSSKKGHQKNNKSKKNSGSLSFGHELIVFPPSKTIRQTACMTAYIPATTITAGVTGVGTIFGNSGYQPLESTPKFDTATGFMTPTNGSDTQEFSGWQTMSALYNSVRTLRSRVRVSCVPSTAGDQFKLVVFAASAADITNLTLPVSYPYARAQIGFREAVCYVGNRLKENTVECQVDSHRVLGLTKQQFMDQPPTVASTTAPPSSTVDWRWVVQYFTMDGLINSNSCIFNIEVCNENQWTVPIPSRT